MLTNPLSRNAGIAAGLLASIMLATPATAAQDKPVVVYGESGAARSERVTFADLDLVNGGAAKLHARVGGAVKRVCLFEPSDRLQPGDYYDCAASAWGDARPQIARAVARAEQLALSGHSSTTATAITISAR